jgi:hypothetical protein
MEMIRYGCVTLLCSVVSATAKEKRGLAKRKAAKRSEVRRNTETTNDRVCIFRPLFTYKLFETLGYKEIPSMSIDF